MFMMARSVSEKEETKVVRMRTRKPLKEMLIVMTVSSF
jgi:hypothetical protein